ncbi:hypothetical protein BD309DRAFT_1059390 [Dichomitus squalens]|uniref:Uncharacterized protein n=1 Tax=Dichomitus squalens TaxID=114155 RepID=A0A4Q9NAY1_9APHY|nr:hypothetical protein BD309DRAFT_1059390 [Dichomitus squalens]TBU51575.1 hypothetical protein BD310DRAFT_1004940 [Dichomitus squalens]
MSVCPGSHDPQVTWHEKTVTDKLCDRFTNLTACAWVSFTNNARVYNLEHCAAIECFPINWSVRPELNASLLSDTFFIYGLLRDHARRASILAFSNTGDQATCLDPQLEARTAAFIGPSRDGWNHVCDKCCAIKKDGDQHYVMRAVVMDGITIGRPCCGVHDCKEQLSSQRARYCPKHSGLDSCCVVVGCTAQASSSYQTCEEPTHRALEDTSGRSALFVLRRRLERLRASALEDDGGGLTDELTDVDHDGECPSKSDEGNTKPRARFGRRRTHNEQLVVATCGTILGRATMYGSEGIGGAGTLLRIVFPTEDSVPEVVYYDNACSLKKHLLHIGDHHFDKCAMPVDPFHAKTKHKDSDTFCGTHCNAAMFPELLDGNRWRFNSSAAEMTNAWFGGFQAMVREMRESRYDFFLDEVIRIRNLLTADDLGKAGAHPMLLPRHLFLHRT